MPTRRKTEVDRLSASVATYLASGGTITKVGTTAAKIKKRAQLNHIIAVAPTKRAERQQEKEALRAAIAELSHIEIAGVRLTRSAHEVSALPHKRGFRLRPASVKRVAEGIGIALNN